jgi:hypothetical protein
MRHDGDDGNHRRDQRGDAEVVGRQQAGQQREGDQGQESEDER